MADIEIRAQAFWTDTEGGTIAVGFATSEDPDDGYVLFEGTPGAAHKSIYVEVSDEIFGSDDAIETVSFTASGFTLTLTPRAASKFGMVQVVEVHVSPEDAEGQTAVNALSKLLGSQNGF